MDFEVVEMPAMRMGAVRGDFAHMQETQQALDEAAGPAALWEQPGVVRASVLPVELLSGGPRDDLPYDAGALLPDDLALPKGLQEGRLPAGRYARAVYVGPYEGLGGAWGRFAGEWLPSSGHALGEGVCFEFYRSDPGDGTDPTTELYIPLA